MLDSKLFKMGMVMAGYGGWRADTPDKAAVIRITYIKHGELHTVDYTAAQVCAYITAQSPIPLATEPTAAPTP